MVHDAKSAPVRLHPEIKGDLARLVVRTLDAEGREGMLHALEALVPPVREVEVDLSQVSHPGTLAAAAVLEALELAKRRGFELRVHEPTPQLADLLRLYRIDLVLALNVPPVRVESRLERIGGAVIDAWGYGRDLYFMFEVALYWAVIAPIRGRGLRTDDVIREMHKAGATAWPIVCTIGALMGVVLAINAGYQLRWFGAYLWIADLVGVSITRELGPLMTAILVAGRSGSTIAAEIGTMKVTEEVDALRTMGLNPGKFLVAPKILGLALTLPGLVMLCDLIAILGGFLIGVFAFGITPNDYIDRTTVTLHVGDVLVGLMKALVFAVIIGVIACHEGFRVKAGADEVGRATTASVVHAILLVIVANALFTGVFYIANT